MSRNAKTAYDGAGTISHSLGRRMSISTAASGERPRAPSRTRCLCSNYSPEGRIERALRPAHDRLCSGPASRIFFSRGITGHPTLRLSARSFVTNSAREAGTGFRRHQHVAIIDFHFKPVGHQRRQLDQSAADDVVTPFALAAADVGAVHHA